MRHGARVVALATLLVPALAAAQESAPPRLACLDSIAPSALARVPVRLVWHVSDSLPRPSARMRGAIDTLVAHLAGRTRGAFPRAAGDTLPDLAPAMDWRDLDGDLLVVGRPDGSIAAAVVPSQDPPGVMLSTAAMHAVRAQLDSLAAAGERFAWPAGEAGAAAIFRVSLDWDSPSRKAGAREDGPIRPSVGLLPAPPVADVRVTHPRAPRYPAALLAAETQGVIKVRFVVDARGRADPATIAGVASPDVRALDGDELHAYRLFLDAVTTALLVTRFEPMRIAGCPTPRLVQQEFTFRVGGAPFRAPLP